MSSELPKPVYRFDHFVLDLVRGALLADGAERDLRPKAFALLRHLVENAGHLVDRDGIMQAVWPGVFVTDDSIAQCIKEVRRALGDDEQRLLRTLPRRGYLFAAQVSRVEAVAVVLAAASAAVAADAPPRPPTGRPRVVVLPFETIGGDPEQGYFAGGLTADLVTDLTRFQSLHVVSPRRGNQPWREAPESPWADGDAPLQRAAYRVSGSVRRAGGRIRVTAELEDAQSGVHLWADRFDRPLDDLFAVQEELAERVAAHLVSRVDREGMRRARGRPPASLDAYDLCLQGRELHSRATEADTLLAREMFDRAIAADPDYAAAFAWQAYTVQRGFIHGWGEPRGEAALAPALALAQRAVEIEPDSPLCLSRLAFVQLFLKRYHEALENGRAAVQLNPCSFDARQAYSDVLSHAGDPEEAVQETRIALALDPFHPPAVRNQLGRALLLAGRPEEALAELRPLVARLPDYGPAYHSLVVAAVESGHMEEARAAVREVRRIGPHWTMRTIDSLWFFRRPADAERFRAAYRAAGLPED